MKIGVWFLFSVAAMLVFPRATLDVLAKKPTPAESQLQALVFLVGQWEGDGWSRMGPGPKEAVHVIESVEPKLGGSILLIEGKGTAVDPETGEERIVHEALAIIGHDATTGYHMRAYRTGSGYIDPNVSAEDGTMVWGFDVPGGAGRIRYTITLNDKGQWFEVGEFSRDEGQTWLQFFEMTLDRKTDSAR